MAELTLTITQSSSSIPADIFRLFVQGMDLKIMLLVSLQRGYWTQQCTLSNVYVGFSKKILIHQ